MLFAALGGTNMAWFLGIIGVLGFAFLMYVSPKFRDFGCGLIALVILGIGLLWFYSEKQNRDYRADLKRSHEAISASQLQLTDFVITSGSYSWPVEGIVKNNSPHRSIKLFGHPLRASTALLCIRRLALTISITVCRNPRDRRTCVVMAQEASANIAGLDDEENWEWDYSVASIEADLPRR